MSIGFDSEVIQNELQILGFTAESSNFLYGYMTIPDKQHYSPVFRFRHSETFPIFLTAGRKVYWLTVVPTTHLRRHQYVVAGSKFRKWLIAAFEDTI